jgi:hypothetical protein
MPKNTRQPPQCPYTDQATGHDQRGDLLLRSTI